MFTIDSNSGEIPLHFEVYRKVFVLYGLSFILIDVTLLLQLWLVFHLCARMGLCITHLFARIHHQANGESMEDLRETLCRAYGFKWTNKRFPGISQLSSSAYVQIHQGTDTILF